MVDECALKYEYGEHGTLINLSKEFGNGKIVIMKMDESSQERRVHVRSKYDSDPGVALSLDETNALGEIVGFMKLAEDRFRKPLPADCFKTNKGFIIIIKSEGVTEFHYEPLGPEAAQHIGVRSEEGRDVGGAPSSSSSSSRYESAWAIIEEALGNMREDDEKAVGKLTVPIEITQQTAKSMEQSYAETSQARTTGPLREITNQQPTEMTRPPVIQVCHCDAPYCECIVPAIRSTSAPYPKFEPVTPVKCEKKVSRKPKNTKLSKKKGKMMRELKKNFLNFINAQLKIKNNEEN